VSHRRVGGYSGFGLWRGGATPVQRTQILTLICIAMHLRLACYQLRRVRWRGATLSQRTAELGHDGRLENSPLIQSERCEMLPPLLGAKCEVEDEVGVERVGDAAKGRQARLVLATLEPGDRRLRDAAAACELGLRQTVLDPEGDELSGDLLVRRELLQRRLVLLVLPKLTV
jgi:hypothetical protein